MKLSVFVVTYNQEKYIRQCLDSILMQKVDFDYEVVIGEDHGTDNTRAICEEYAARYPQVRLLPLIENLGVAKNWRRVLSECNGEYVAMCEGDDYWSDPYKLQKQIDFMEEDKDEKYVMCFHEAMLVDEKSEIIKEYKMGRDFWRDFSSDELRKGLHPSTQTVLFRQKMIPEIMPLMSTYKWNCNDTLIFSLLGKYGDAGFISSIKQSAWRIHCESVWSSSDKVFQYQNSFHTFSLMKKNHPDLHKYFAGPIKTKCARIVEYSARDRKYMILIKYYIKLLFLCIMDFDIVTMVNIKKCIIYNLIHK